MAFFSKTKKETSKKNSSASPRALTKPAGVSSKILEQKFPILTPRITEKGTYVMEKGTYVFNVSPSATKTEVARLVELLYKVRPVSVNILSVPSKRRMRKGRIGRSAHGRKAYVSLKKGDTITFA